jgi:phosphomannomutase/phosphoglucomutase
VVGRDGRLSGPELAEGLIAGLRKAGRNVIDLGMVPTPVVYFGATTCAPAAACRSPAATTRPTTTASRSWSAAKPCRECHPDLHARIAEDRLLETKARHAQRARHRRGLRHRIAGDVQLGQRR